MENRTSWTVLNRTTTKRTLQMQNLAWFDFFILNWVKSIAWVWWKVPENLTNEKIPNCYQCKDIWNDFAGGKITTAQKTNSFFSSFHRGGKKASNVHQVWAELWRNVFLPHKQALISCIAICLPAVLDTAAAQRVTDRLEKYQKLI